MPNDSLAAVTEKDQHSAEALFFCFADFVRHGSVDEATAVAIRSALLPQMIKALATARAEGIAQGAQALELMRADLAAKTAECERRQDDVFEVSAICEEYHERIVALEADLATAREDARQARGHALQQWAHRCVAEHERDALRAERDALRRTIARAMGSP